MKRITLAIAAILLLVPATAAAGTAVPGKTGPRVDADENGIADIGVVVQGHYTSLYAYDASGKWYWDLGDGRFQGNVGGFDQLDQETLTECDYVVNYRGTFENDPFQDTGTIENVIRCHGYDGKGTYHYQIVHETSPQYRGNPDWSIWGSWEYHVLTESGAGNQVRPVGNVA